MSDPLQTRVTLLQKIHDHQNDAAWRDFVELYTPFIYRFCCREGLAHDDASDVVQETLRAVASGIAKFEYQPERAKFRTWLYRVARSKLNTFLRRKLKHPEGTGRSTIQRLVEEHPAEETEEWEMEYQRHMFRWAVSKVKHEFGDKVWSAFWKTAVEERPVKEIGEELEMSAGSIYAAKFRVINRLREKVESVTGELEASFEIT
ncbi:MAG: sigma-70 family RNA polymerase sigma factor [Verrucomicrobiota bacterium]